MLSDSFFLSAFFVVVSVLAFFVSLRLLELTPVSFDLVRVLLVPAFCPDEGFVIDLLVTFVEEDDLLPVVTFLSEDDGFVAALLVTVVDLFVVTVVFLPEFPELFIWGSDLLTELFPEELPADLLYSSGWFLANIFSPSLS